MGKKGRKKQSKATKKQSTTLTGGTVMTAANLEWTMSPPIEQPEQVVRLARGAASKLLASSRRQPWAVHIRRANIWLRTEGKPLKQYRPWWISFLPQEDNKAVSGMVSDYQAIQQQQHAHDLTGNMFLACLHQAMDHFQQAPSELLFFPHVSFRDPSSLLSQLDLPPTVSCSVVPAMFPNDDCNKVTFLQDESKKTDVLTIRALERHLQDAEGRFGNPNSQSALTPCITQKRQVSIRNMRRLFYAARVFHDARPWEILSNWHPVVVRLPNKRYFAVVAGNGSWVSRGVYLYNSWDDMKACAHRSVDQTVLQYWERTSMPFCTLDHVAELGLEISTKDGKGGQDSYPLFYYQDVPLNNMTMDFQKIGSVPPKQYEIAYLPWTILAITKFVQDYCHEGPDDAKGKPLTALAVGEYKFDVVDDVGLTCPVAVECRPLDNPHDFKYADVSDDMHLSTLSLGSTKECNFCQKPEALLLQETGARLLTCTRCKKVNYCAKRCQASDWKRHKKECRPPKNV